MIRSETPRAKRSPLYYRLVPSDTFYMLRRWPSSGYYFQDALRAFFQPIKPDNLRLDFYTVHKREATEHDADYIKKYGRTSVPP